MKKLICGAGVCALLVLFIAEGDLSAQTVTANHDFELQKLGPWEKTGDNISQYVMEYDVTGWGKSWCWKRRPGYGNNGGLKQMVPMISGVTYSFEANVAILLTGG